MKHSREKQKSLDVPKNECVNCLKRTYKSKTKR